MNLNNFKKAIDLIAKREKGTLYKVYLLDGNSLTGEIIGLEHGTEIIMPEGVDSANQPTKILLELSDSNDKIWVNIVNQAIDIEIVE